MEGGGVEECDFGEVVLREPLVITDGLTSYNWTHKSAKLLS